MQSKLIAVQTANNRSQSIPTAVLYARVSSKEQEQGYSIPAQQELLRSYARDRGIQIVEEFVDAETAKTTGRHLVR